MTALATWVDEIADRVRATELANGDEKTAKELRRAVEMVAKHDPKVESRLTNRIDVVAGRLGTLASAVSTTSAELARRDGELAVLRREVEQGNARIRDLGGDLGRAASTADVERLDQAIASLSAVRPSHPTGDQTDRLAGKVDYLAERVDTLAKTVAATAAGLAGREGELATVRQRLDERARHFEQALAELRMTTGESALGGRLDALEATIETAAESLAQLEAELRAAGAEHASSLNGRVDDLAARLDSVKSGLRGSAAAELAAWQETAERGRAEVATRLAAIEREHCDSATELASKLETMAATVDALDARDSTEELECRLVERLRRIEQEGAAVAAEIARVSLSWASDLDTLRTRLEEVAEVARDEQARQDPAAEQLLSELSTRLDSVMRERQVVAAQIAQASENEVAELRTLIDGLRMRFAPNELGLPQLDSDQGLDLWPAVEPAPGDGRLRLELRAFELRAERAEKAAEQNRDAVLAQLERMTEQLESRFQKLESDTGSSSQPETADEAEVVQLRGAEV
ncbi:MAG: hypothetical protein ACR2G9_00415 [Gaiellaceae bacterium]